MEIKKVYFFYIIDCRVSIENEYDPYSGSRDPYLHISGADIVQKSKNYSTAEDALNAQDSMRDEKHYEYSPVMEGWIRGK